MVHNLITEEIREIRHQLAAQFDNDVYEIGAETRRRQSTSGRRFIRLPHREPANSNAIKAANPTGESGVVRAEQAGKLTNENDPPLIS